MKKEEYTPGPWEIGPRENKYQAIPDNTIKKKLLEELNLVNFKALSIGSSLGAQIAIIPLDESNRANACLIKAAPNLLKICKQINEWFEGEKFIYSEELEQAIAEATN